METKLKHSSGYNDTTIHQPPTISGGTPQTRDPYIAKNLRYRPFFLGRAEQADVSKSNLKWPFFLGRAEQANVSKSNF